MSGRRMHTFASHCLLTLFWCLSLLVIWKWMNISVCRQPLREPACLENPTQSWDVFQIVPRAKYVKSQYAVKWFHNSYFCHHAQECTAHHNIMDHWIPITKRTSRRWHNAFSPCYSYFGKYTHREIRFGRSFNSPPRGCATAFSFFFSLFFFFKAQNKQFVTNADRKCSANLIISFIHSSKWNLAF